MCPPLVSPASAPRPAPTHPSPAVPARTSPPCGLFSSRVRLFHFTKQSHCHLVSFSFRRRILISERETERGRRFIVGGGGVSGPVCTHGGTEVRPFWPLPGHLRHLLTWFHGRTCQGPGHLRMFPLQKENAAQEGGCYGGATGRNWGENNSENPRARPHTPHRRSLMKARSASTPSARWRRPGRGGPGRSLGPRRRGCCVPNVTPAGRRRDRLLRARGSSRASWPSRWNRSCDVRRRACRVHP